MLHWTLFTICAIFIASSEAAYVDTLSKCSIKDQECLKKLYHDIIHDLGSTGAPELGIPPVDPIQLNDVTVTILGLLNLTLVTGTATGIGDCEFDEFSFDIEKGIRHQENTCSVTIEGKYSIDSNNSLIRSIFGENIISGEGNGKAVIDKLHLKFDFPAYAHKLDDGETIIKVDYSNIKYDYEIRGSASFAADTIYLGKEETSKTVIPFLNQNWNFIMKTFGKPFVDRAADFYFEYTGKFFNVVPSKHYILEDLTPFIKP